MVSIVPRFLGATAIAAVLLAAGCAGLSHLPKTDIKVPETWSANVAVEGAGVSFSSTTPAKPWWQEFNDPVLSSLVERALAECRDVKAAEARVREARAQRTVAVSDFFPHASLGGRATRTRSSRAEMAIMGPAAVLQPSHISMFEAGFDASWEIDLFGGTRAELRGAEARIAAQTAGYEGVLVSVAAETARNYFELRGAQAFRAVLDEMLQSERETTDLLQKRRDAGTTADLEVTISRGTVEGTAAQIPATETAIQRATTSLAVLLSESPDQVRARLGEPAPSDNGRIPVTVGVPSEVLRARPDVRQAEHGVETAAAAVGVSTAEIFPKFYILGSGGTSGTEFSDLGVFDNRFWTVGPSVRWPILDIGRVLGNIHVQRARHEQALHDYEKTVLLALKDVEDAVVAYREAQKRKERLSNAVMQFDASFLLAQAEFKAGTKDYLYVLATQRSLLAAREAKTVGDTDVATAAVALCKALGGGWPEQTEKEGK